MNRHQVLTGAANAGDHCYSVGSVEGVPFTAYASGCNIVILASDFNRVQIIPGIVHGNVQVRCLDCSTDVGKVAAAYAKEVCIFEPTPLLDQVSSHRLDYRWVQTASISAEFHVQVLSWNLSGTRLLTGGESINLWQLSSPFDDDVLLEEDANSDITYTINGCLPADKEEPCKWNCIWKCKTAQPVAFLKFSPDGSLFASAGWTDRLVKIWYSSKEVHLASQLIQCHSASNDVNFTFIYIAHPRAVTGLTWRKTSKFMPKDSVANMLITSCRDNICRIWVQTLVPEDGLINYQQIEALANQTPQAQSQRHRRRRMWSFNNHYKKRQASQFTEDPHEVIPNLPSTYSVHDFHSFSRQGSGITPGLHFHLAASINAETDIPLVPRLNGGSSMREPNFVLHWLNNKEMAFTHAAEHVFQEVSGKVLQAETKEEPVHVDVEDQESLLENDTNHADVTKRKKIVIKSESPENTEEEVISKQGSSTASSSTSIATDTSSSQSQTHTGDFLDRKIEALLRDWHRAPDLLFSVYPVDGSFLVWLVEWLDENNNGTFRQAQVSFSSRIPNAIPLGDAATMSHHMYLYSPHAGLDLRMALQYLYSNQRLNHPQQDASEEKGGVKSPAASVQCAHTSPTPTVCMISKHTNGSLNLWHLTFVEESQYTHVLNVGHTSRVCGHRFRINDIACHPVLPLLLTTSHHNLPEIKPASQIVTPSPTSTPCCPILPSEGLQAGFCSELILWKVDPVGPLSKSGGMTELARINSPETAAFANVAWIPTLLPSTMLGSICNSPSACFVASDGQQLRIYQSVIDARTLLTEILLASRRKSMQDMSQSSSTSSGLGFRHGTLQDSFRIVSDQSTSRPACIVELDSISDATHDWKNTQLLHVFQEQLITSHPPVKKVEEDLKSIGLVQPDLQAMVDLRHSSVFEEPFYLVLIEKQDEGNSVLHMWRIVIASQEGAEDHDHDHNLAYATENNLVQESDHSNRSSRSNTPEPSHDALSSSPHASPLRITTNKVCSQVLPLPAEVEIVHAAPAAGHLSSSNIYPACFAPYLICTACSDNMARFWKCEYTENATEEEELQRQYTWVEWEMMLNKKSSAVQVQGQPLYVSCAYSGRMACAYKHGRSFTRPSSENPTERYVNISVSIFECESTGGSEWVLEDTINLRNVSLPQPNLNSLLNLDTLFDASQRNKRTADALIQKLANEESVREHSAPLQRLLSVPSCATLQTLRQAITEQGNQCLLMQKSLVQLDWVSVEDGSHVLTVAMGSKILLFTPVSNDIAQANLLAMKASKSASRPLLKQASSMVLPLSCNDEIRWMRIRTTHLSTVDALLPLPMQLSWVRHGILVVGMDNEMQIYSQWRMPQDESKQPSVEAEKEETVVGGRKLTEEELLFRAQESSKLRLPAPSGTLSRSTSSTILNAPADSKRKKVDPRASKTQQRDSLTTFGPMPDFGLFEASRLACPVLPQYHPKQLMELLGFGKLRRVKAILSHLVRCLSSTENVKKSYLQVPDSAVGTDGENESSSRSWSRSRALSLAASTSPLQHSPLDPQSSVSLFPEEVTLDYVEIQSIPPLPLFALLAADKETNTNRSPTHNSIGASSDQDYSGLFDVPRTSVEDSLDDILYDKLHLSSGSRERPSFSGSEHKISMTSFGPKQAILLTKFLTHSHLPGLSSLDQMHFLALADTVASFNTAISDRFGIETDKSAQPKEATNVHQIDGLNVQITTESLDDCGLRFLLAMRHYTYLLRCLPLVRRAQLQSQGLGSHSLVWAFHSETQEELLQLVPCIQRGNPKWSELKELGIGWWVRNNNVLRRLVEKVSKAAFQSDNNPLDAALFYLAMKKKTLVWGLFRSIGDQKMTAFFQNNFSQDKWRKSALKNAFALLGKQRFEHAAAFFLLAGALNDAVDVCLNKLDDLQLAMVIVRLYEGEIETVTPSLRKLLFVEVLGCQADGSNYIPSHAHPNPFIRCMARWILQDYCGSLTTLLQTDVGYSHPKATEADASNSQDRMSANPSVFNFYLFLRVHPLVVRRQRAQNISELRTPVSQARSHFKQAITEKDRRDSVIAPENSCEDSISPLERRLFFTTAHAHFRAGCPALALEVLSRLPNNVSSEGPMSPDDAVFDFANVLHDEDSTISTGIFTEAPVKKQEVSASKESFDWSQPVISVSKTEDESLDFDWSSPVAKPKEIEPLELKLEDSESGSGSEHGIEMEALDKKDSVDVAKPDVELDIMAQQLKFIACLKTMSVPANVRPLGVAMAFEDLIKNQYEEFDEIIIPTFQEILFAKKLVKQFHKTWMDYCFEEIDELEQEIMMEELSTLATGYEVDGGQLRYQLYIWLEKSVAALKDLCNYGCSAPSSSEAEHMEYMGSGAEYVRNESLSPRNSGHWDRSDSKSDMRPSLHEILLADKMDFEAKLQRASRRKHWLKANEALLRTLLSYCSLHGAHGGGLSAVRMELILLLHELQQERSQQQLLSPLPFPTTLPLLAASVACQKTVVADPVRHLQSLCHDILQTITDMVEPPAVTGSMYPRVVVLRDLSTSLSACIYESLCDSDSFIVKQGGQRGLNMEELISSGVVYQNSHLLAGHVNRKQQNSGESSLKVTTHPNKWPGVQSLRALLAQDKDEDSPRLHTLLCESFLAVYVSQLIHALSTCDCHVLYRLLGQQFTTDTWSLLFGGGTKVLLHVSAGAIENGTGQAPLEKTTSVEASTGLLDSLTRQRIKLHMKLLGQLGQTTTQPVAKEDRPTYREQFVPPHMSMVYLLMSKPHLSPEWQDLDYESNASQPSDEEEEVDDQDIDDVFGESYSSTGTPALSVGRKKTTSDSGGVEQLDPSSYTWGILRYATVKLAHQHLCTFLSICGLDMSELPVMYPLIHTTLKCMEHWLNHLKDYMDSFGGPPPNYIPGCFVENTQGGPAILKYKALLELHNTPFRSNHRIFLPVKRLWNYLVRQESVQDIFIRYIFKRKPLHLQAQIHEDAHHDVESEETTYTDPIRIIHKDQDTISSFCVNKDKPGWVALSTPKEIQELDISVLLEPIPWLEDEAEYDVINLSRPPEALPTSEYLVVQHPVDKLSPHVAHSSANSAFSSPTGPAPPTLGGQTGRSTTVMKGLHFPGSSNPQFCQFVLERSRHMLKPLEKRKVDGIRRLAAHPSMPVYLSGSQDGSVFLWEWKHKQAISSPRPPGTFAKVTQVLFNPQGNKFGVTDGDGNISLWQVGTGSAISKPFFSAQCHTKLASDFAFVSSSSLIATAGHSAENKNVCLWDTLLPQRKSLVASFVCHEHGSSAILYAMQNQVLITAGKKGDICIFDVRQKQLRHKFPAHDSPIKCIALDPGEEFFATGSADGDIKVWGLNVHVKLYSFTGEHTKSTLFRNISNGVSQMEIDEDGRLFSCGADGSMKLRTLPDRDTIVNSVI